MGPSQKSPNSQEGQGIYQSRVKQTAALVTTLCKERRRLGLQSLFEVARHGSKVVQIISRVSLQIAPGPITDKWLLNRTP